MLIWDDKSEDHVYINTEYVHYWFMVHGLPPEIMEEEINKLFKKNPQIRDREILKAYDKAHETNYLSLKK